MQQRLAQTVQQQAQMQQQKPLRMLAWKQRKQQELVQQPASTAEQPGREVAQQRQ